MRKLLNFSITSFLMFLSCLLWGCQNPKEISGFQAKTTDEYFSNLLNTTMEIELIVNNQRSKCFYSNDSNIFVFTIKYEHSNEYGYIYDNETNDVYCIENQELNYYNTLDDVSIEQLLNKLNFLFYLKFDTSKFDYIDDYMLTICNRKCDHYRFTEIINGNETVFNIYIDRESSFCLRATCSINDNTIIHFETKKFTNESEVNQYRTMVTANRNNKQVVK